MAIIYGLFDRETGELRYVGKANDPAARLKSHMRDAYRRDTPVYRWIRKHGAPEMRVLLTTEQVGDQWKLAEKMLIAEYRKLGFRLLNVADGGDEPHCPKEVRAANGRRNARAVHDDPRKRRLWELRRLLGDSLRRGYVNAETKAKLRDLAHRHPDICPATWRDL